MATMKDVAQVAGVSTATVSRALMDPDKVSTSTRHKVEQAVINTGYSPSSLARNLRRNESKTILALIPDICDPYFSEIIRGIEDAAMDHGYLVLLGDSSQHTTKDNAFANLFYTKQADGMLLLGSDLPFDISKPEQKNYPPLVMACEYNPELEIPTVHIDNLTAAFEAVNYLTQKGHTRIATIMGASSASLSHFRHQGYEQALHRYGITPNPEYIFEGDFSFASGAHAASTLLTLPEPPTALFCHNDMMAIGAMQQAKRLGIKIPEELSIIGFDDITFAEYCEPALTTVSQPRYDIGRETMLMLLDILQGKEVSKGSRLLDAQLVIRESVSTPIS
ncbi:DNA-binding transcriptional regulator CytR [Vibrio sp. SS-MA-C1-2]|uniref:DNA-binding transcriptional regulator CytR n=1 Tax=Vibrio sp. SS-MA-C1-2 TaxID=2908646 RepID=UPI001F451BF4|nr:DNA-binding transcriptional regulator CytR [Vibrio sp. SS-MA-C1-2]UJF19241.1 DNA-binding transcriptional regulator CytR [Vibrio sp. SS-MA-C1-2]